MCQLSWNPGASASRNFQGLYRGCFTFTFAQHNAINSTVTNNIFVRLPYGIFCPLKKKLFLIIIIRHESDPCWPSKMLLIFIIVTSYIFGASQVQLFSRIFQQFCTSLITIRIVSFWNVSQQLLYSVYKEVRSTGRYHNFSLEPQEPFIHLIRVIIMCRIRFELFEHQLLSSKRRWCNMSLFQCTSTQQASRCAFTYYSPVDVSGRHVLKTALVQNWAGFSRVDPTGWLARHAAPTQLQVLPQGVLVAMCLGLQRAVRAVRAVKTWV